MTTDNEPKAHSKFKVLVLPEARSKIPAHLLAVLDEQERYMVESMSKMEARNEWLETVAVDNRAAIIDLDERMAGFEKWRSALTSKWSVFIGLGLICLPVVVKVLIEKWIGK